MAIARLGVAAVAGRLNRRRAAALSLLALLVPSSFLALAPNLIVFAGLRIAQGLCMATAFALTQAEIGGCTPKPELAGAFAAYVTGNVACNQFGRVLDDSFDPGIDHGRAGRL